MKKPVTKKLTNAEKGKIAFCLFFISLTLTQLVLYISAIVSDGYSMHSIMYNYYTDSYMDFFNPLKISLLKEPYSSSNIGEFSFYSPLYILLFRFASYFAKSEVYDYDKSYMTHFSETTVIYVFFAAITTAALSLIIYNIKKGNTATKIWFLFLCLFSAPVMYNYERGSIIVLALIFLFLFVYNYDSDKKSLRHASLVFLALAVAIKPYALIFIVLLLREKRFKDSLLEVLYSALLYIVPAFFTGGLSVIGKMFEKIPDYINQIQEAGAAYRTDIFGGLDILSFSLGYTPLSNDSPVKYIIWAILVISLVVCGFISKSKWKRVLALTLVVIAGPFAELETSLLLLFVPLVLCLDSDEERKAMDMVHIFLFVLIMAPLAIKDCIINFEGNNGNEIYLHSYLVSIAIMLFIFMLFIETVTMPLAGIELNDPKPQKEKTQKEKTKKE